MNDNDIEKNIEQLSKNVEKFSNNTSANTIVGNIKNITFPFKLNLFSVCICLFFIILFALYFTKPSFIMSEIKDEETFFIETKLNYKYLTILSIIITLIISYLLNIINNKFNLFS